MSQSSQNGTGWDCGEPWVARHRSELAWNGAEPRRLTQQAGRVAFELGYAGVYYDSRYGHSIENWAILDWAVSKRFPINQPNSRRVADDDPDLLEALRILRLILGE